MIFLAALDPYLEVHYHALHVKNGECNVNIL